MSYILDALKKNKPENDKDQVPDLSSDHASEYDYSNFDEENSLKRWLWPSVVMVLVLIVAILTFMLLNPSADEAYQQMAQRNVASNNKNLSGFSDTKAGSIKSESSTATVNPSSSSDTSMSNDATTNEPVVVNKPLQVAEPVVQKVARPNVSARVKETPPQRVQAAKNVTKSDLPKIIYTTHIYATQPDDRFVMLNGRAYAEGDKTQEGFVIKEILENDLLIVYKGQEFTLPSLEDVNVNN
ncbi:MAG: hypothetical protein CMP47_04255 [Rickettsiales bacterium]|jgi:general secretion pathway protein B|nr:hypothetical protein [Rickettsiales bacterium]